VSVYGYLNCHDCRQTLWLGKALHRDDRPIAFHIGEDEQPPHWSPPQLNQALWKFLADHTGHRIDVRLEHAMTDEMFGYQGIGGDSDGDISFEAYLAGWQGLAVGGDVKQYRLERGGVPLGVVTRGEWDGHQGGDDSAVQLAEAARLQKEFMGPGVMLVSLDGARFALDELHTDATRVCWR
jgi:hypothetical protein